MTLTYRITLEDFMNAQRLHRAKGLPLWRRTTHFLLPGLLLTVLCFGIIVWLISKDPRFAANFQPLLILCTIWLGAFWMLPKYSWRRAYQKDRRLQEEMTAQISHEGIRFRTPNSDATTTWGLFIRYLESDKIFVLNKSNQIINILPKRFFGSGEVEQFHELLRRKLPAK